MASLTSITGKAATSTKATSPIAKPTLTSPVTKPTVTPPTTTPPPVKAPDSVKVTSLRTSTGRIVAKGDLLLMRYQGTIINSTGSVGAEFDANFNFSTLTEVTGRTPFEFELGAGKVIQGWEQGLLGRRIGEVVELTIPPSLGYGSTPPTGSTIPANSTLRFRVEILGAFSPDLFAPESTAGYSFATLQDLGIKPTAIGLTNADLLNVSASRVGLDGADVLIGKDVDNSSQPTKSKRDLIIGLAGDDKITGGLSGDFLIGGLGKNTYIYNGLDDSLATTTGRDKIYDFTNQDKIDLSAIDAFTGQTGNQAFVYIDSKPFTGTQGEVRFIPSTATTSPGILQINTGTDKLADMEIALMNMKTFSSQYVIL